MGNGGKSLLWRTPAKKGLVVIKKLGAIFGIVVAALFINTQPATALAPAAPTALQTMKAGDGTCTAVTTSAGARAVSASEIAMLRWDPELVSIAAELGVPAGQLAREVASYLSEDEVEMTVKQQPVAASTVTAERSGTALMSSSNFQCAEARAGYYLFNIWGTGICAVFAAGTGGLGGVVCSLVLVAGGGEINFNSVCD